jgi:Mg/Co/Ni transporter MgtE
LRLDPAGHLHLGVVLRRAAPDGGQAPRVDPAVVSAPLVDATGLNMYFLLARAVLGL